MRKVTAGLFQSIDGVVESPNLWQFDSFDPEMGEGLTRMIASTNTVLLGRVSYQEWAGYWPDVDDSNPFTGFINPVEKFVASTTLDSDLGWQNSSLIPGDVNSFVTELKQTDGDEIAVCGSITLVRHLFFAGLIDSLTLMIHPVIAGTGRHLFADGDPVTQLVLQDARYTSKGNAILSYGRRSD